ncbi:MAG: T9SS type A sorting domain-containing protein, partial [bacterium]
IIAILDLAICFLLTQSPTIKWGRTYGGEGEDQFRGVLECADKGFVAVGSTNSFGNGLGDIYVMKLDSNGDSVWAMTYGDSLIETGYAITRTNDSNYVITGTTSSYGAGGTDIYAIKIDEMGAELWSKTYGGNLDDFGFCIDATNDDGYIITGSTYSFGNGNSDIYVVKIDSLGEAEWIGLYGTALNETGLCVQQTSDSGYIICGSAGNVLLGYEWCLLRYNRNGILVWDNFQGSLSDDFAYSVQEISRNNYVIGGNFAYEMYIVRTDTAGYNIWALIYGGAQTDCAYSVRQTADRGYIIAGITNSYGAGGYDAYLVRTATDEVAIKDISSDTISSQTKILEAFPSPFSDKLMITYRAPKSNIIPTVKIYDIMGRLVQQIESSGPGNNTTTYKYLWDGSDFSGNPISRGIYYVVVPTDKGHITKKVIRN